MRIRILHCVETIGPGGVEQRRLSIARYLDSTRYEQKLTCSQVIGEFDKRLLQAGTTVERLGIMGSPFNLSYYKNLFRVIRSFQPQIIHGAVFEGVISAVIGGMFCRVPIIMIEETSEPVNRSWRGHLLFRFLAMFADAVVAISPSVYDYLTITIRLPVYKTHLVLNGVEPPVFPSDEAVRQCRDTLGLAQNEFVVGSVGRMLDNHKLFSVLISAFKKFSDKHANVKLLLVGDGVDKMKLELLTQKLGLTSRVIFAGHQPNVLPFYNVMNIFALVPAREGFGMAAVEAMFFALPVIATRVGGLKQVVVDKETGLLLEPGDQERLTEALEHMYSHSDEAAAMGKAGFKRASEKFTAKRYVGDLSKIYESLITNKLHR